MQFQKAYDFLIDKLERELSPHLTYHSVQHTRNVVEAARHIGASEKLHQEEMELLLTAALFHDAGFLKGYDNHEELSCTIARENLPSLGYTNQPIQKICESIMATTLPQRPRAIAGRTLCDAALSYLGTDDYCDRAENLFSEFSSNGKINA